MNIVKITENPQKSEFYPTPESLVDRMLAGIDWSMVNSVLEPSAGKGDLALAVQQKYKLRFYRDKPVDIDCIEIDQNLRHILNGKELRVVHDDFLTYDLPIDASLGYAYIVPFKNKQPDGSYRNEAAFILGYKGMHQLAMRTGAYKTINVLDVREGELQSYNRLTEEIELDFIEDEDEREQRPVIGYVGYFRLINGTEKTIYMTKKQVEAHEKKHRKGQYMGKGWRDDWDAMARKTVYRQLIGKWGLMSIDYRTADAHTIAAAEAIATGQFDADDAAPGAVSVDYIDLETGEVAEVDKPSANE